MDLTTDRGSRAHGTGDRRAGPRSGPTPQGLAASGFVILVFCASAAGLLLFG